MMKIKQAKYKCVYCKEEFKNSIAFHKHVKKTSHNDGAIVSYAEIKLNDTLILILAVETIVFMVLGVLVR